MSIISPKTKLFGIIGNPISHSLSPLIHNQAFKQLALDAVYLPFLVKYDEQNIISALKCLNISGANVTLPYKSLIIPQLDYVDPFAQKINSVNTIVNIDGSWQGYSTDGAGFLRALAKDSHTIKGKSVLMLGAGGAAKALAHTLINEGVAELYILNRTKKTALSLISQLDSRAKIYENQAFEVLINATSLGLNGELACSKDLIAKAELVLDLIYNPAETKLLKLAKSLNKNVQNGLPMLIHQAAISFEYFTKQAYPPSLMDNLLKG